MPERQPFVRLGYRQIPMTGITEFMRSFDLDQTCLMNRQPDRPSRPDLVAAIDQDRLLDRLSRLAQAEMMLGTREENSNEVDVGEGPQMALNPWSIITNMTQILLALYEVNQDNRRTNDLQRRRNLSFFIAAIINESNTLLGIIPAEEATVVDEKYDKAYAEMMERKKLLDPYENMALAAQQAELGDRLAKLAPHPASEPVLGPPQVTELPGERASQADLELEPSDGAVDAAARLTRSQRRAQNNPKNGDSK